ncbi:MAG: LUD domain-containing protein [Halioglobus sp.]
MINNPRTDIIARIRHASRGASADNIKQELASLGQAPASPLPSGSLAESFLVKVLRNHGTVDCVGAKSDAAKAVAQYLYDRYRTRKIIAGNDPKLAAMPWRDGGVLPRFGAAEDGDLASVSYARVGIAETGSIVTWTGKANPATNNLLVEDHIVLLDIEDLVKNLEQAWQYIEASQSDAGRHRGINFISGPSSTADIDIQLTMGAHGPRNWHIIVIGNLPPDTLDNARQMAGLNGNYRAV